MMSLSFSGSAKKRSECTRHRSSSAGASWPCTAISVCSCVPDVQNEPARPPSPSFDHIIVAA